MSSGLTFVLVTWISFNFHPTLSISIPCHETYQAQNGRQCYPCNKGFYKISDCVANGEQARCRPCGHGKYQPSCDNSPMCDTCRPHCPPGQIKVKDCETTSDINCECNDPGSFWLPDPWKENEGHCRQHSKCKDGEELVKEGTPYNDTVCMPCQDGVTHSNKAANGRCRACSVCNTTVIQPCNVTHDVICDRVTTELPSSTSSPSASLGIIVGIISGAVLFIIIVIVVIVVVCKRRRQNKERRKTASNGRNVSNSFPSAGHLTNNVTTSVNVIEETETAIYARHRVDEVPNEQCTAAEHDDMNRNEKLCVALNMQNTSRAEAENETGCLHNDKTMTNNALLENNPLEQTFNNLSAARNDSTDDNVGLNLEIVAGFDENSEISTDANLLAPRTPVYNSVSQRGFLPQGKDAQREDQQTRNSDNESLEGTTSQCNEERGAKRLQGTNHDGPDFSENIAATNGTIRGEVKSKIRKNDDSDWFELMDFLANNLGPNDFKRFYRWLTAKTNEDFNKWVDVTIDYAEENFKDSRERNYQLMNRWRRATPQASLSKLLDALRVCGLHKVSEELKTLINNKQMDRSAEDKRSNTELNEHSRAVEPYGELSHPYTMRTAENDVIGETHRDTHRETPTVAKQQMMILKRFGEDIY